MATEWKQWSPNRNNVRYKELTPDAELVLGRIDPFDEWELDIRIKMHDEFTGYTDVYKRVRFLPSQLDANGILIHNFNTIQPFAEKYAISWLSSLSAKLTGALCVLNEEPASKGVSE